MSEYSAQLKWNRDGAVFSDMKYSRSHEWRFDGGAIVYASSSPHNVPVPMSDPSGVDPEEAFAVSVASCHMLWFLATAAHRGFVVDSYIDNPVALLEHDTNGRMSITRITMFPDVEWQGDNIPVDAEIMAMHNQAHQSCFIASSIKSEVHIVPVKKN